MTDRKQPTVIYTSRGLSIAGTRITLYAILDYLHEDWPPKLIRDWFNLTDNQMADVLAYIEDHRDRVEREYQQVIQQGEEIRRYWEDRNNSRDLDSVHPPLKPPANSLSRLKPTRNKWE
ncbi:MAG: DUF433 domain-containing protein [Hormoscilla sp. GM7CHS1pb]|nr:DUF433 domain-containing protein [Hormoscilla sp. GM7CHS1pb]